MGRRCDLKARADAHSLLAVVHLLNMVFAYIWRPMAGPGI
jgi:hypothetical protein